MITESISDLPSSAHTLKIAGSNFGQSGAVNDVQVQLRAEHGSEVLAHVYEVAPGYIRIRLIGLTDINVGTLRAIVTVRGVKSVCKVVATIKAVMPVVVDPLASPPPPIYLSQFRKFSVH